MPIPHAVSIAAVLQLKKRACAGHLPCQGHYSNIPDAIVFRNSVKDLFTLMDKPYKVSFISLAALDFNEKHGKNLEYQLPCGGINSEGMEIMRNKIRTIYRIAATNCHDSMILGTFGCGAFRLP